MNNQITIAILVATALIALFAGVGAQRWLQTGSVGVASPEAPEHHGANPDNIQRPEFELADLNGTKHHVSEWDGKVLVVNFWASWCPPCRKEMPGFIELQDQYSTQGVQFVGIALDNFEPVKEFCDQLQVNYPILLGDSQGSQITKAYGNRMGALPYTAVINRSGTVAHVFAGEVKKFELEQLLNTLI